MTKLKVGEIGWCRGCNLTFKVSKVLEDSYVDDKGKYHPIRDVNREPEWPQW